MRASSTLREEDGMTVRSINALLALRMRVSMSATGSVSIRCLLPARLRHSGDCALVRELPQADPAEAELAEDGTRTAAPVAAAVRADLEPLRTLLLVDEGLLRHYSPLRSSPANGKPSAVRSARAWSSSFADVVIATSSPRICPIES